MTRKELCAIGAGMLAGLVSFLGFFTVFQGMTFWTPVFVGLIAFSTTLTVLHLPFRWK